MNHVRVGGQSKKRRAIYIGAVAALIVPGVVVYGILSLIYRVQDEIPASQRRTAPTSTSYSGASTNRIITANSYRDFGAVCGGFTVKNAAPFTDRASAVIATFSESPRTDTSWSFEDVGYGKNYTNTDGDFTKINTVACLHEIRDTKVLARACTYDRNGAQVTIKYYSVRYKLSYYEAKTGTRIADAGNVEAPAGECPSFIVYDEQTLTAYATPQIDVIDIAHKKFTGQ